jgi:ethanolamine utilization protein EutA (predicted chaperonin)
LLYIALRSVGIGVGYMTTDLINSTLKVFNKSKGKMTIMDSCKIKAEHQQKWDSYFSEKEFENNNG